MCCIELGYSAVVHLAYVLSDFSSFGMLSSPLPFAGVGLEMLSLSLGFALFHAAKADSKEYLSDVELKLMKARGSKCLPVPLGSKISTLHCVRCFVCE